MLRMSISHMISNLTRVIKTMVNRVRGDSLMTDQMVLHSRIDLDRAMTSITGRVTGSREWVHHTTTRVTHKEIVVDIKEVVGVQIRELQLLISEDIPMIGT